MIVYITTNLVNNKKYIGSDTVNNPKYIGSGKLLLKAVKKYGRKNFKKEIVEYCTDQNHLREREKYWIKYYNAADDDMFYNMSDGGQGSVKGQLPWNHGLKIKNNIDLYDLYEKMYIHKKDTNRDYITDEWKLDHSNKIINSVKFQRNKNKKIITRKNNNAVWHSEETKKKISLANKGREKTDEQKLKRLHTIRANGSLAGGKNPSAKNVKVTCLDTKEILIFKCMIDVMNTYNISRHYIKKGHYKNLKFELIGQSKQNRKFY